MVEVEQETLTALSLLALLGFVTLVGVIYLILYTIVFSFIPWGFKSFRKIVLAFRFRIRFGFFPAVKKTEKAKQQKKVYQILHDLAIEIEESKESKVRLPIQEMVVDKFWGTWRLALTAKYKVHYNRESPETTYQYYLPDTHE